MAYPSDRLTFDPVQENASEPWRSQHAFVGAMMVAELWEAGGEWCVRRGGDFYVHSLPSEGEAKELIRMLGEPAAALARLTIDARHTLANYARLWLARIVLHHSQHIGGTMNVSTALAGVMLAATAISPLGATAQTVYKCAGANGVTVYSSDPCGKDAKLVTGTPLKPRKSTDEGTTTLTPAAAVETLKRRERTAVDDISDSVADSNCRRSARNAYVEPSTAKIENAGAEIKDLRNASYYGGTAAQRQLMVEGNETKIIGLRNIISTEESHNDQLRKESDERLRKTLEDCDKAKADREKAASQQ